MWLVAISWLVKPSVDAEKLVCHPFFLMTCSQKDTRDKQGKQIIEISILVESHWCRSTFEWRFFSVVRFGLFHLGLHCKPGRWLWWHIICRCSSDDSAESWGKATLETMISLFYGCLTVIWETSFTHVNPHPENLLPKNNEKHNFCITRPSNEFSTLPYLSEIPSTSTVKTKFKGTMATGTGSRGMEGYGRGPLEV